MLSRRRAPLSNTYSYQVSSRTAPKSAQREVWCRSETTEHRWRLQFQVRGAAEEIDEAVETAPTDVSSDVVIADEAIGAAASLIRSLFEGTSGGVTPTVANQIEKQFGYAKSGWPLGVIRQLARRVARSR